MKNKIVILFGVGAVVIFGIFFLYQAKAYTCPDGLPGNKVGNGSQACGAGCLGGCYQYGGPGACYLVPTGGSTVTMCPYQKDCWAEPTDAFLCNDGNIYYQTSGTCTNTPTPCDAQPAGDCTSIGCPTGDACTTYSCQPYYGGPQGQLTGNYCKGVSTGACSSGAPVCGNGICEAGENNANCPVDCPPAATVCNDPDYPSKVFITNSPQTVRQDGATTFLSGNTQDWDDNSHPYTVTATCPVGALCGFNSGSLTAGDQTMSRVTSFGGCDPMFGSCSPHTWPFNYYIKTGPGATTVLGTQTVYFTLQMTQYNTACNHTASGNITVIPPLCPAANVTLSANPLDVTRSEIASAPAGWFGGAFASNAPAVATVSGSAVTGVEGNTGGGIAGIYGSGWSAPNGATNCSLSANNLAVSDFTITPSASPGTITQGNSSTITVNIASVNGAAMPVTVVRPASLPAGWSITPASATANAGNQVTFTLSTTVTAAIGTNSLSFTGTYNGHSHSGSTNVTVNAAAPTVSMTASPTSVAYNGSSTLTWTVINATSCANTSGNMPAGNWNTGGSGSAATPNLTSTTTYTITCSGPGGSTAASATVTVGAPSAVTIVLTASPNPVNYNTPATLNYAIANATACTSPDMPSGNWTSGTSGSVPTPNLTTATTYHLNCTGAGAPGSAQVTVSVNSAPPTLTFTASPTSVAYNGSSTLTWTVANATTCTDNNANMPAGNWSSGTSGSGSTGALTATKTYSLTCTGPGGSVGPSTATVTVAAATCPTGATAQVALSNGGVVDVTQTIIASVPGGWSNVQYTSANPAAATVNASTGVVTGKEGSAPGGASSITATGDYAGATACSLTGATATVRDFTLAASASPSSMPAGNSSILVVTINGVNGGTMPVTVVPPASASLPSGWSISPASASASAGGGTVSFTLTTTSGAAVTSQSLTFTGTYNGHSHTGSAFMTVTSAAPPPPLAPSSVTASNATCGKIILTWTDNSTTETGFKIYKDGVLLATTPTSNGPGTGGTQSYTVSLGTDTALHTYSVAATDGTQDSAAIAAAQNPIAAIACASNLSTSDKDIMSINGIAITPPPSPCNGKTDLSPATSFNVGDIISFQINMCNSSNNTPATNISLKDTLTNLQKPPAGWNVRFYNGTTWSFAWPENTAQQSSCPNPNPASGQYTICGTTPNQTITVNLTASAYDVPINSIRNLSIDGQLAAPATAATYSRFQNKADITYNKDAVPTIGTKTVNTPLILYYSGAGVPSRQETSR